MIEVNRHTLGNGLRIVHNRNTATQMVAVNLLYCVGSKDEDYEHTGLAHFVEHLMFSGSKNAPDFDLCLQEAGGENNAWTTNDITNYYEILPSENLETAFWLESDRMADLLLSEKSIEVQRSVVIEEFKQRCLNTPYGDLSHLWRGILYKKHPYRWPVIGKQVSDIENMPEQEIRRFRERYYAPDNAILSVVGNVDSDFVFRLAEKWFGDIPASGLGKSPLDKEPAQSAERSLHVSRNVPHDLLLKAYRMCGRNASDYQVCDLLSDVLANGRSSRLFRNIYAEGNLVSSIDASVTGDLDDGALLVRAQLLPGVTFDAVDSAIKEELRKVKDGDVSDWEIEKNVNRFESNALFGNINNDEKASNLAYYEMLGDANSINTEVDKYRAITRDRLSSVASKVLSDENCSTVYYEASAK